MFDPKNPPKDLHDDISTIEKYRNGEVEVKVLCRRREDDSRHFFLGVKCSVGIRGSWEVLDPLIAVFRITSDGDPTVTTLMDHLVDPDPLSDQAIQIARTWLRNCTNDHKSCVIESAQLPARFLEICDDDVSTSIFLRELKDFDDGREGKYVALSHCWGHGQNLCTTRLTLEAHKSGIEISRLPQTFKDAVLVVRKLGVRYLWIDSLCIVQDEINDWQVESANMSAIYRNAHLVLGAACGVSDTQGFLGTRHQLDVILLDSPGAEYSLNLQLQPPKSRRWFDSGGDLIRDEPLSTRAWCLQERYLPRRMLHYGLRQMFWECQQMNASEDGDAIQHEGDNLTRIRRTANVKESVQARTWSRRRKTGEGVNYVDWYAMVQDYTSRGITKDSDRLPALIGLAKAVADFSKDQFLAGLWKNGLIEGLIWCGSRGPEKLKQSKEYIAPSWSWASVIGPVEFPIYKWFTNRARWKARQSDFEPLARHVSHTFELRDFDQYGRLESGSLTINAPLLPITSIESRPKNPPDIRYGRGSGLSPTPSPFADKTIKIRHKPQRDQAISFWLDGGFDTQPPLEPTSPFHNRDQTFILLLTRMPFIIDTSFADHLFGLIVIKLPYHGTTERYKRIGFVDGLALKKIDPGFIGKMLGREGMSAFEVMGFEIGKEMEEVERVEDPNSLARDPWGLEGRDVVLV